jgi:NTE family protein
MAVVLGGGGVAGIAWQTGLLHGLADSGADVTSPEWSDMLLGTSAGSTVAAQVTSDVSLEDLYARQVDPALQIEEPRPNVAIDELTALFGSAFEQAAGDRQKLAQYIGKAAIAATTVPESERRAVIARRLPSHEWPDRDLRIVAVDAESGRHRVLDRTSGVSLVDAVAASCAIPGMWPPVTIGTHRYVDGGVRSAENADLAVGFAKVLVLQVVDTLNAGENPLEVESEYLRARGASVEIIRPDDDAADAIGPDPTDPAVRTAAAEAGYRQSSRIADAVEKFKSG